MHDWNVVVTVLPEGFRDAVRLLEHFGTVATTDYYGLLVMKVDDRRRFMESVQATLAVDAALANAAARLVPVSEKFVFECADEFRSKSAAVVAPWAAELGGQRFYVRMHRRGFKGRLASDVEERRLGDILISHAPHGSDRPSVCFDHPEIVIAVETVGNDAGLARFTASDLDRYELLRLD